MYTDGSSCLPSLDSFQIHIPLTSTPKRSNRSQYNQPLSSTLSLSTDISKPMDLSISAITLVAASPAVPSNPKRIRHSNRRRSTHLYPSTIIKKIDLKYLLYSNRAMKHQQNKHLQFTEADMKIYLV